MNKNKLTLLLLALSSSALADPLPSYICLSAFEGPYMSANIGFGEGGGKKKFINAATNTNTHKNSLGFNGVDGGIGLGYLQRFGNIALGAAFDANWVDVSGFHKHVDGSEKISVRLMNSLQLYGRAGYVLYERFLPFIGLGWGNSAWRLSSAHTGNEDVTKTDRKKHRQNALLWKAGLDILVDPLIAVGFEYTGTAAERKSYAYKNEGFFDSWRPQYNKFALTLKYIPFARPNLPEAPCLPSHCVKAFQGFYVSGNIGYGSGAGRKRKSNVNTVARKGFVYTNGVDGGVGTGYMHRCGKAALGLAFDANWSNASGKRTNLETQKSQQARLKNALDFYGRAGYVFAERIMPFLGLGWENAAWKGTITDPPNSQSATKRLNGFLWKLGADFLLCQNLTLGFEYTGSVSQRKTYRHSTIFVDTDSGVPGQLSNTWRPQYNKFALTVKLIH